MTSSSNPSDAKERTAWRSTASALIEEYQHLHGGLPPWMPKLAEKIDQAMRDDAAVAKRVDRLQRCPVDRWLASRELRDQEDPLADPAVREARRFRAVLRLRRRDVINRRWHDRLLAVFYRHIHRRPASERPTALCLSGGGIRSATFGLGVLQGLADKGQLDQFRYLSSVSGGGYIACWLQNYLRLAQRDMTTTSNMLATTTGAQRQPRPTMKRRSHPGVDAANHPISRLRAYSNYLSPKVGLSSDMLSLVATFLRNLALNLSLWLALIAGLVSVPRLYIAIALAQPACLRAVKDSPGLLGLPGPCDGQQALWLWPVLMSALACGVLGIAYMVSDLPSRQPSRRPLPDRHLACHIVPVFIAVVIFSMIGLWASGWGVIQGWTIAWIALGVHVLGIVMGLLLRRFRGNWFWPMGVALVAMAFLAVSGFVGGRLVREVIDYGTTQQDHSARDVMLYATWSVPLVLTCFWVQMTLLAGFARPFTTEDDREWWARSSGDWLAIGAGWIALFGGVLYVLPWLLGKLSMALPGGAQLSLGGLLLGGLTSALGYWSKNGQRLKERSQGFLTQAGDKLLSVAAGAVLVLVVMGVNLGISRLHELKWLQEPAWLCQVWLCQKPGLREEATYLREEAAVNPGLGLLPPDADEWGRSGDARAFVHVLMHTNIFKTLFVILVCAAYAFAVSFGMGINTFSLHGMYGNRLVRAYLGAARNRRSPHWLTGFDPKDNLPFADFLPPEHSNARLYPVINMALNLVQASNRRLAWQQRKAASFVATPLRCGNNLTGYASTKVYGGDDGGMSIGRALTISGAAASPNMGYHSSALVTMVMTLFNVRLGWWLSNPSPSFARRWQKSEPRDRMRAMLDEAFGRTTDDGPTVYLSDGGHFENLGLYEMVRRRCHSILVVDAGCDARYEYADLHNAVRKVRVDFGIRIDVPRELPGQRPGSDQRMAVATIRYSDRDGGDPRRVDGQLFILKPVLTGNEPPDVADYARSGTGMKANFPQQTTADQFFDEAQFESYRVLGLHSVDDCWRWAGGWKTTASPSTECDGAGAGEVKSGDNDEKKPAAASGGDDGVFAGLVKSMGPGVALASALTVGGTLGVVGSAPWSGGESALSADDRDLLRQGIALHAGELKGTLTPADGASVPLVVETDASVPLDIPTNRTIPVDASQEAGVANALAAAMKDARVTAELLSRRQDAKSAESPTLIASAVERSASSIVRALNGHVAERPATTRTPATSPPASAAAPEDPTSVIDELSALHKTVRELKPDTSRTGAAHAGSAQ